MNATDYIKDKLSQISSKFEGFTVRYALERKSHYHIVEIERLEELKGNEEFLDCIMKFWFEFDGMFENENLLISEEDSLNDMSNLVFENTESFKGIDEKIYSIQRNSIMAFGCVNPTEIKNSKIFEPSISSWSMDQFNCA